MKLSSGETYLLDRDELDEALEQGEITKEQHTLACDMAEKLMTDILEDRMTLMKRYEKDLRYMQNLQCGNPCTSK